jgi:4-hydroxy-3-polyprenylbenzoate decarboxylase
MAYKNQQEFIRALEVAGELVRIRSFVNPRLEMAEITDRVSKSGHGGKALLFENTGTDFPVLMNAYGSERRMCMALGVQHLDDTTREIEALFKLLSGPKEGILDKLRLLPKLGQFASWMPTIRTGRGDCQEMVMPTPDISKLPVITCWPRDGGPFVTLPIIHTRDLHTGIRNVGMYRMQVFGPTLTGMHWHKHKVSARHFAEYRKTGQRMPVAVALGGDPVYAYSATAPLPDNVDEYMLAGFLRKKRVELVKCLTQPAIEVPADADFIIEGFIDPTEDPIWEGPFGDHTGYYSLPDWYPRFHITAITHRKNPVYPATIVGIPPQEDAWLGKATERIFLAPIKMTLVPEIIDMEMPIEGVFHNLVIAKIRKEYAGQGQKVMNAMWGAGQMMFNKILVVTDEAAISATMWISPAMFSSIGTPPPMSISPRARWTCWTIAAANWASAAKCVSTAPQRPLKRKTTATNGRSRQNPLISIPSSKPVSLTSGTAIARFWRTASPSFSSPFEKTDPTISASSTKPSPGCPNWKVLSLSPMLSTPSIPPTFQPPSGASAIILTRNAIT